ncbi:MAG: hypothetical protein ABI479_09605 [Gallionella sp.]
MKLQFGFNRWFFAVALLLGNVASAFGETAVDGAAPAQPPEYDFSVISANKDKTHPYYGQGLALGFVVNGVQGGTLILVRGKTYEFDVNTGVMHDFYFSTKPVGYGTGTLTKGVQGQFTYKGVVTFSPTAETPDTIYYACRNHKFMGGEIHVVNRGEEGKFKGVKSALKP